MSDLRIALVAEGSTDYPIIHAALSAFMTTPFVLTLLQPEAVRSELGGGWGGVLKWCNEYRALHEGEIDDHPLLGLYDMLIIHLDVDVSTRSYRDYGQQIVNLAEENGWETLPCVQLFPPVTETVRALSRVLYSWLLPMTRGPHTVFCLPAQSSGTWLAVATVPGEEPIMRGQVECDISIEKKLSGAGGGVRKKFRIDKSDPSYIAHSPAIITQWNRVKEICTQAQAFETEMIRAVLI